MASPKFFLGKLQVTSKGDGTHQVRVQNESASDQASTSIQQPAGMEDASQLAEDQQVGRETIFLTRTCIAVVISACPPSLVGAFA